MVKQDYRTETKQELAIVRYKIADLEKNLEEVETKRSDIDPKVYNAITMQYGENLAHLRVLEGDYLEDLGL